MLKINYLLKIIISLAFVFSYKSFAQEKKYLINHKAQISVLPEETKFIFNFEDDNLNNDFLEFRVYDDKALKVLKISKGVYENKKMEPSSYFSRAIYIFGKSVTKGMVCTLKTRDENGIGSEYNPNFVKISFKETNCPRLYFRRALYDPFGNYRLTIGSLIYNLGKYVTIELPRNMKLYYGSRNFVYTEDLE